MKGKQEVTKLKSNLGQRTEQGFSLAYFVEVNRKLSWKAISQRDWAGETW